MSFCCHISIKHLSYSFIQTDELIITSKIINQNSCYRCVHVHIWCMFWRNLILRHVWHTSGSYPGRQAAQCVSWPARGPADSPAGSSPTPRSRIDRGSTPDWCCCRHAPPHSPSSNWRKDKGQNLFSNNSVMSRLHLYNKLYNNTFVQHFSQQAYKEPSKSR